jgi:hypothetical protein
MEIVDGQHRLAAAEKLGVPIYYQIDPNSKDQDIVTFNVNQKRYRNEDYLKFHRTQGNPEYIKLHEFLTAHCIPLAEFLRHIVTGGNNRIKKSDVFATGGFVYPDRDIMDRLLEIRARIKVAETFIRNRNSSVENVLTSSNFKRALFDFLSYKLVDFKEFMDKLEMKIDTIGARSGAGGYYTMLSEIYNFKRKNTLDLAYQKD